MKKSILFIIYYILILAQANAQNTDCSMAKASMGKAFAQPTDISKMNNYDVYFYKLDVDVERNTSYISGNVSIYATAIKNLTEFVFELHDTLKIDSVIINGAKKTFTRSNGVVTTSISGTINQTTKFTAVIYYKGYTIQDNSAAIGNGLNNSPSLQVTWSLSESYVAYQWWPCKQVLYDKADSAEIWITTDSVNKAGSNGLLVKTTNFGNGKKRYEWKTHYPIDYYLISVAVAKYTEYNMYANPVGVAQPVLVQNYIYDTSAYVKSMLNLTPGFIENFSTLFGTYPFALEKYGHSMAPVGGGMEHQTMTTLGPTSAYTFNIISHELAHQWFGDYVTCGSWADIWLNEGFASYCEYIANQNFSQGQPASWMSSTMAGAKNAWGWVYVHDTLSTSTLFNGAASYNKGAVILHMLRYEINNDSIFFLGIRNYLNTYKYSTAVSADFQKSMEQTSGKNFSTFFDQWLRGLGYPVFSAKYNVINNNLYINLTQTTTNTATPIFKTSIDIRVVYTNGDTVIRVWVDSLSKIYQLNVTGRTVTNMFIDYKDWILNDLGTIVKDPNFNAVENVSDNLQSILVYPNPAESLLNFTNAKDCKIEITDLSGRSIYQTYFIEQNSTIDLSNFDKGVYFIKIDNGNTKHTSKFVKY